MHFYRPKNCKGYFTLTQPLSAKSDEPSKKKRENVPEVVTDVGTALCDTCAGRVYVDIFGLYGPIAK